MALKVLRTEALLPELERRFLREANVRIEHPNVVRTLDAGITRDGAPYIVLELLEGRSLDERLTAGKMEPRSVLLLARQAASGLAALHREGIVHRDVKPANLFCCRDGSVKLLDFGVAHFDLASIATQAGELLGTLLYFAPEQFFGAYRADARSDVWALGVVLYHALTGAVPFERRAPIETAMAIVQEPHPPLDASIPAALAAVVERCLAKRPQDRLPSAVALRAALDTVRL